MAVRLKVPNLIEETHKLIVRSGLHKILNPIYLPPKRGYSTRPVRAQSASKQEFKPSPIVTGSPEGWKLPGGMICVR